MIQRLLIGGLILLGTLVVLFLYLPGMQQTGMPSGVTGTPAIGGPFTLIDGKGNTVTEANLKGSYSLIFFGFTHCPDVCPTTLADIAAAMKTLGADAERVQALFITVDPERDTAADLDKYVKAFDPRFIALRGDAAATQRVAKDFKIYYEKRKQGDGYTVDHSAQSYVIDPQGRLRLLVRHDRIAQDLAPDLRTILKGA